MTPSEEPHPCTPDMWQIVPDRDANALWDLHQGATMHLWRAPHSLHAPLGPLVRWSPVTERMEPRRPELEDIPICPTCLYSQYSTDVENMASLVYALGANRWNMAWSLSRGVHDGKGPRWHVRTHFQGPCGAYVNHPSDMVLSFQGDTVCTLGELARRGTDHPLCATCFYQVFPEFAPEEP